VPSRAVPCRAPVPCRAARLAIYTSSRRLLLGGTAEHVVKEHVEMQNPGSGRTWMGQSSPREITSTQGFPHVYYMLNNFVL
jgi:hypothetical protein